MVFLGGAVLANIVSHVNILQKYTCSQSADGRQGRHVDIKSRVAGTRLPSIGETGRTMRLARAHTGSGRMNHSRAWAYQKHWSPALHPTAVSLSRIDSSASNCCDTLSTYHTITTELRPAPICLCPSQSASSGAGGKRLEYSAAHGARMVCLPCVV